MAYPDDHGVRRLEALHPALAQLEFLERGGPGRTRSVDADDQHFARGEVKLRATEEEWAGRLRRMEFKTYSTGSGSGM
jgi:hypothetical protein